MILFRSVRSDDTSGIMDVLAAAGDGLKGMSTLRPYPALIENRVARGVASFVAEVSVPGEEVYFFVIEDTEKDSIVGTGAVYAAVGLTEAFYSYRVSRRVFSSRELGIHTQVPTLFLTNDYTGSSEVGSLFVSSEYRGTTAGRLTAVARMLFMAEHRKRFSERVFAEMRGFQLDDGTSPFWEGIGRHFFGIPFPEADDLSARGNKVFIAELMPSLPIYVPLLPVEVQQAIGMVHRDTEPARRLLEREGFAYSGYVDIFDGGPTLEANVDSIRSVTESRVVPVEIGVPPDEGRARWIVTNRGLSDFRAAVENTSTDESIILSAEVADQLGVDPGDDVRVLPFRPGQP